MRRASTLISLAIGMLFGAAAVSALWRPLLLLTEQPADAVSEARLSGLSMQELGKVLMARVATRFVHQRNWGSGVTFYDAPRAFGGFLCATRAYEIQDWIIQHRPRAKNEPWEDLTVDTLYGIWRRPTAPDDRHLTAEAACARYKDFDHLIQEDHRGNVDRAVYVMNAAFEQARSGKVSFAVACLDRRDQVPGKQCDGVAILKALDLKNIFQVRLESETADNASATRVDQIMVGGGDTPHGQEVTTFTVRDVQHYGKQSMFEADVLAIDIKMDCIC